ncbi:MAG: DinB family protein [Rhodospirillaceae bacterium]
MDARLERIGRYAAVARGMEREGAYNGAKLLRAALASELVRYAEREGPSGGATVADALEALVAELGADLPPGMAALLAPLPEAVRAGRTVSLREAPPVRICRVCGTVFLGDDVPATCPACEAPALSFSEELPVWYLAPADRGAILAALAAGPRHLAAAIAGHSDEALARQPAPGEWSARQALEHLLFTEELLARRIGRLLDEDEPDLAAAAVWADTPASDEGSAETGEPASAIAARIGALRHATVARLAGLDDADWGRGGTHAEWGRVTVLSQAAYFARHEASHLAQLVAAAQGRLPGREA